MQVLLVTYLGLNLEQILVLKGKLVLNERQQAWGTLIDYREFGAVVTLVIGMTEESGHEEQSCFPMYSKAISAFIIVSLANGFSFVECRHS